MSANNDKNWVRCTIENTGFSSERRFEVDLGNNGRAVGTAFIEYLRNDKHQAIKDGEPPYNTTVVGFVQCRIIKKAGNSLFLEFPSTDVFHVPAEALEELCRNP